MTKPGFLALLQVIGLAAYLVPVQAVFADEHDRDRDRERWREREWHEHERREEWRERHPYYEAPPVVMSPPPAVVYEPPPVIAPAPVAPGLSVIVPIRIR